VEKPTPIWKSKAEEINLKADTEADSLLDKLKASKWTGAILLGAAVVVIILLVRLF
jgi:hypothetical protein